MTKYKVPRRKLPDKPACWRWDVPLHIFQMAAEVHNFKTALECLEAWTYSCSICGEQYQLVADHDHSTRLLRGLLCLRCNVLEPYHINVFESYRKLTPAMLLGINVKWARWR